MGRAAAQSRGDLPTKEGSDGGAREDRGRGQPWGLFQDAPKGVSVEELRLLELACMKQEWGKLVGRVKRGEEYRGLPYLRPFPT